KTRLAIETAESLKEGLGGAVWFVGLAALADAGLIPGAIGDAMGLPRLPDTEPMEQMVTFFNGQRVPALVILDNCEHLLDDNASRSGIPDPERKGAAPIVRALLERVPALTVLATSRQPLNLDGEREMPVLPLPVHREERGLRDEMAPSSLRTVPSVAL